KTWAPANTFALQALREAGRWDPAYLAASGSLPRASGDPDRYVALTSLASLRDARFSRRELDDEATYRFFEVADADVRSGCITTVQSASGFELRKKGRIKQRVAAGD